MSGMATIARLELPGFRARVTEDKILIIQTVITLALLHQVYIRVILNHFNRDSDNGRITIKIS